MKKQPQGDGADAVALPLVTDPRPYRRANQQQINVKIVADCETELARLVALHAHFLTEGQHYPENVFREMQWALLGKPLTLATVLREHLGIDIDHRDQNKLAYELLSWMPARSWLAANDDVEYVRGFWCQCHRWGEAALENPWVACALSAKQAPVNEFVIRSYPPVRVRWEYGSAYGFLSACLGVCRQARFGTLIGVCPLRQTDPFGASKPVVVTHAVLDDLGDGKKGLPKDRLQLHRGLFDMPWPPGEAVCPAAIAELDLATPPAITPRDLATPPAIMPSPTEPTFDVPEEPPVETEPEEARPRPGKKQGSLFGDLQ